MHAEIRRLLPIDDIMICLHNDADHCACRKPKPGLLLDAAAKHGIPAIVTPGCLDMVNFHGPETVPPGRSTPRCSGVSLLLLRVMTRSFATSVPTSGPRSSPRPPIAGAVLAGAVPRRRPTMNISDLMTRTVKSCGVNDNLQRAAQLMWANDCGAVPVVAAKAASSA